MGSAELSESGARPVPILRDTFAPAILPSATPNSTSILCSSGTRTTYSGSRFLLYPQLARINRTAY